MHKHGKYMFTMTEFRVSLKRIIIPGRVVSMLEAELLRAAVYNYTQTTPLVLRKKARGTL